MIPLKLTLKNFMCYKDATLDLDGVHLACLSGDNGAGKSALLDAITWSLWGKARASDDELIAQGQTEMQTDFEFRVNEQLYRIVRTRSRKGAGHTDLNFQARTPEETWRNISGNLKKATQQEIIKALRMEYETFINSAFLLQGRADEFTNHTPGERKKVLADILGLSYYDGLEAQAKEETREADSRGKHLAGRLEELDEELSRRPQYAAQERQAETNLEQSQTTLQENEKQLKDLQQRLDLLKVKEDQRQASLRRLGDIRKELSELIGEIKRNEIETEKCRRIIARRVEIEEGYRNWQDADAQHELLLKKFTRYEKLIKQRRDLEDKIRKAEVNLAADQRSTQTMLTRSQEQSRNLPTLEKEYAGLEKELTAATSASEEYEQKRAELQKLQQEQAGLEGEAKHLADSLKVIEKKAKQVPPTGERCDRCGTVLSEEAHNHTVEEYRKEYRERQAEVKEKKQQQEGLGIAIGGLEEQVRQLNGAARRNATLQKQIGEAGARLDRTRQEAQQAVMLQSQLTDLTRRLDAKEFCQEERQTLTQVAAQIVELGYDPEAYQRVKDRLNSLKGFTDQKHQLDEADRNLTRLEEEAGRHSGRQTRLKADETDQQSQADSLAVEVAGLSEITARRDQAQQQANVAKRETENYKQQLWQANENLKRCDEWAVEKKLKETAHNEAVQQAQIFKELSEAFGKKGVQALIIESILPELEDETNKLLGGMSDGRMNVRFETQRDSKKGDAIETLDLKISDESGVRAYELFSGGEAFRVNFAVRVALSKLLARRNGAALRTLFIDEGFGSQDGAGRERLVEAIRSIEPDFEKVLVITHIQELKDVFPVRIDVVKTPTGSQISVN